MLLGPWLAALSLSLSDTSVATVRSTADGNSAALDLTTTPSAVLGLQLQRSLWTLDYTPSLGLVDVMRDSAFVLMHGAGLMYTWEGQRLRLSFALRGTLGTQSYLAAATAPAEPITPIAPGGPPSPPPGGAPSATPAEIDFIPQQEIVRTGSITASAGMGYVLSSRWVMAADTSYEIGGGLGDSAAFIPLYRGPSGTVALTHFFTRRDTLTTSLSSSLITTPERGGRFFTLGVLETWAHRFDEHTNGYIGAGATYLVSRGAATESIDRSLLGAGAVGLSRLYALSGGATLTLSTDAALDTGYNRVLGVVNQRIGASFNASWGLDRTTLGAGAHVSQTLPVDALDSAFSYGFHGTAGYRLSDFIHLQAGGSWSHQVFPHQAAVGAISPDQWSLFFGVAVFAPPLVF